MISERDLVSPAALSLLTTTNPEGPARNRALSIWQATTAAGATAGIVAGSAPRSGRVRHGCRCEARAGEGPGLRYRPWKRGSRLSMKAWAASRWSSVSPVCTWWVTSRSMQSASSPVTARLRFSFM